MTAPFLALPCAQVWDMIVVGAGVAGAAFAYNQVKGGGWGGVASYLPA